MKLDRSPHSTVAVCTVPSCPWRAIRPTVLAASAAGAVHERTAHDSDRAAAAHRQSLRRRRGDPRNA